MRSYFITDNIASVNLRSSIAGTTLGLENDRWGPAVQAGVDVKPRQSLFLNLDVKKIYIGSDLTVNGTRSSHFKLDPLAVGARLGWCF